jgi:hypothetical protein
MRIVGVSRGQRFSRVGGLHLGLNITRQVRSVSARLSHVVLERDR